MIFDSLARLGDYAAMHPRMGDVKAFLAQTRLDQLPVGRTDIYADELFALVGEDNGKGKSGAKLEAHRKHIDVQIALSGADLFGWRPLGECDKASAEYSEERDIQFFDDEPEIWLPLETGTFAMFFPHDAHAPLAGAGSVRKIVFKLRVAGSNAPA